MEAFRKAVGRAVFNRWIRPPDEPGRKLRPHSGDYGHAFLYETLFCRDDEDLGFIGRLATGYRGGILDLAGGAGRVAERLVSEGRVVTLVDRSVTMLEFARRRRRRLPPAFQSRFRIVPQDLRRLDLGSRFAAAFAVNHGLEHLPDERSVREALRRIAAHLVPGGSLYLHVHCAPFWESRPDWKRGAWRYGLDLRFEGARYRVWERTRQGASPDHVVWEHAVMDRWLRYTLLSTPLLWRPPEWWRGAAKETGFSVLGEWGEWSQERCDPSRHGKLILALSAR